MNAPMPSYEQAYAQFKWAVPSTFNFGADVVDRWADDPRRLALIWENAAGETRRLTYREIALLTNRVANALAKLGVVKGDRIIIMMPRIPEWQIALVAALKLGAVPIPCIEMLTARDLEYRIDNSGAKAVVCRAIQTPKFAGVLDKLTARVAIGAAPGWHDFNTIAGQASDVFKAPVVNAEDPAIIYYTSGSTGHPKGVTHASRALYSWRFAAINWLDLHDGDRIWCTADTGWSKAGTSVLFGPWSQGACSIFYDGPFDPRQRLALIEKHKVNVYCAPGTELFRVVDEDFGAFDLSALRRTVSAGEVVHAAVAQRWKAVTGMDVCIAYGLTELLMTTVSYPGHRVKPGSMGLSAPGSVMDIVDHDGRRLPDGVEGHVAMLAPNPQIMLGYWRDPERSERCYVDGPGGRWFITGDTGTRDADGYFSYIGRSDDVINSAGYRIGPLEVENALLEHPSVQECAVVPSPDTERGEIVKAFVVLRPGYAGDAELIRQLQDHVKVITAPYKYPRAIEFLDTLPKTMTGKILRRDLRNRENSKAKSKAP